MPGIAFNAAADLGNVTASSLTHAYSCGSGSNRLLVVVVAGDGSSDVVTGATYNGVAMTLADKVKGDRWFYMFHLVGPASGSHNVVISASSSIFMAANAADYQNVNPTGQPDNHTTAHKTAPGSDTITATLTTVADKCWTILGSQGYDGNFPPVAGAGSTRRTFDATLGDVGIFDSNADITPAGSTSMTWNRADSGHEMCSIMASFKPASSALTDSITLGVTAGETPAASFQALDVIALGTIDGTAAQGGAAVKDAITLGSALAETPSAAFGVDGVVAFGVGAGASVPLASVGAHEIIEAGAALAVAADATGGRVIPNRGLIATTVRPAFTAAPRRRMG